MTKRVTLSLPDDAAAYLDQQGPGNASAFVASMLRRDAIARSAAAHVVWFNEHPTFADDAEMERVEAERRQA